MRIGGFMFELEDTPTPAQRVYRVVDRGVTTHYVAAGIEAALELHQSGALLPAEGLELTELPGHKLLTVTREGGPSSSPGPRGAKVEVQSGADGPASHTVTASHADWALWAPAGRLT
jgi:hypothetical protein